MAGKVIEVLPGKFVTVDFSGRMAQAKPKPVQNRGVGREQAAENVENFTGGLPSGLLGMSGDFQEMGRAGGNALMAGLGKTPVVGPMFNYLQTRMQGRSAPTSEEVGAKMGLDPESGAFQAGTMGAPDWSDFRRVPNALAMTLFHGTPHKFNKFDLSKIGTGGGAQAFGYGLYFAESPGVAGSYRQTVGNFDQLKRRANDAGVSVQEYQRMVRDGEIPPTGDPGGHLYEVEIPDSTIDKMLDWDLLSDADIEKLEKTDWWRYAEDQIEERSMMSGTNPSGGDVVRWLQLDYTPEEASKILADAGFPGIKFYDGSSRRNMKGTRNIVLFNADDIKQVKRDGDEVYNALWRK